MIYLLFSVNHSHDLHLNKKKHITPQTYIVVALNFKPKHICTDNILITRGRQQAGNCSRFWSAFQVPATAQANGVLCINTIIVHTTRCRMTRRQFRSRILTKRRIPEYDLSPIFIYTEVWDICVTIYWTSLDQLSWKISVRPSSQLHIIYYTILNFRGFYINKLQCTNTFAYTTT